MSLFFSICCTYIVNLSMEIFTMYFRSQDKGGLAMMSGMILLVIPLLRNASGRINVTQAGDPAVATATMLSVAEDAFPVMLIITIVGLILGFFALLMLYKRREK